MDPSPARDERSLTEYEWSVVVPVETVTLPNPNDVTCYSIACCTAFRDHKALSAQAERRPRAGQTAQAKPMAAQGRQQHRGPPRPPMRLARTIRIPQSYEWRALRHGVWLGRSRTCQR